MEPTFNLTGLKTIYNEYMNRKEQTLVFEIKHGKGLFNFLMFYSDDDIDSKDKLFLFLRRTNTLIEFKLYGSHRKGDFFMYISDIQKHQIINELGIKEFDGSFNFNNFLENLNNAIPNELLKVNIIKNFKEVWPYIKKEFPNILDKPDKTILYGIMKLSPNKKPQEKTLRKLYLLVNGEATAKADLISVLQSKNTTLAWTSDTIKKEKSIIEILTQLNTM
jgi:hypothetical protein